MIVKTVASYGSPEAQVGRLDANSLSQERINVLIDY
jgi:hypothetical protein